MTERVVRGGYDTYVDSGSPKATFGDAKQLKVRNGIQRTLLFMPLAEIRGRTVLVATLSPRVWGAWPSQTVSVQPLSEKWSAGWAKWNKQPNVRAGTASVVTGAVPDKGRFGIDVTALLQQVANGADHHGWRITTNGAGTSRLYGFDADLESWILTYETSDAPQEPTDLHPNGGVIGKSKFTVSCDFTDLGGSTEQTAVQVQVSPTADAGTAWNSGEVATTVPELDLEDTSYPGLADGATTRWRCRVKDGANLWSPWSDWATVTRDVKAELVLDNPANGVLWDPSSSIDAHLDSGIIREWRVRITNGGDRSKVRYDSRRRDGNGTADLDHQLPLRNDDGKRIFVDDGDYWLNVRVWDRLDRQHGGPGDPPFIELWEQVHFDDDAALSTVTQVSAEQIRNTPRIRLTWSRLAAPDAWVVLRDNEIIARLDPDEVDAGAGTYRWRDADAVPNVWHQYKVKGIVNGKQTKAGPTAKVRATVDGLWFLGAANDGSGDIVFEGKDVTGLRSIDKRATYDLPGMPYSIDIVTAYGGISGAFEGSIELRPDRPDVMAVIGQLNAIRDAPGEEVRVVYGTKTAPCRIKNLSVDPHPGFTTENLRHTVRFEIEQVGEFEVSV